MGPKAPERVAKRARKEGQMTTKSRKFIKNIDPACPRGFRHPPGEPKACFLTQNLINKRKNLKNIIPEDAKKDLKKGRNSALIYLDFVLMTVGRVPRNTPKNTK